MVKFSVVIPNWNGAKKLRLNLPAVLRVKLVDEVIVVDDSSSDDSIAVIRDNFPSVILVSKSKNQGFSSTVNLGVSRAKNELVFVLNTDAVPAANCLEKVMAHFDDPRVFSVGCSSGGTWAWASWNDGLFWHHQSKDTDLREAHQTLWASGGSAVFRKSIWQELGGLDVLFNPFYEEDLDLGYRATKRGFINIFEPSSKVEHYIQSGVIEENFSKASVARVAQRNLLIFIWKNITSSRLMFDHLWHLLIRLLTSPGYFRIIIPAIWRLPQILKKRRIESRAAKLGDEAILGKYSAQ